jgi:hypothetical protein
MYQHAYEHWNGISGTRLIWDFRINMHMHMNIEMEFREPD